MPATSENVIRCSPPSTRRARERENAPSPPSPPAAAGAAGEEHEQADEQDHRAEAEQQVDQQAAGVDRLGLHDHVVLLEQLESSSVSANVGTSVSKFLAALPFGSSGGLTAFLNSPSTVSPCDEMRSTLPASTWARNVGL